MTFSSTVFEINKCVSLCNNKFIRLTDLFNSIQSVTRSALNDTQKNDYDSVRLSLENKKRIHSSSGERTQFIFSLSHENLNKHRILRYKVNIAKGIRIRIYLGEKKVPQHQVYEDTSLFSGMRELSLDLDEISFRYIEKSTFPISSLIFWFDSFQTQGHPEIELSNVRLEKDSLQSPNFVQLKNVRINGRILETLVFPPESELVFPISVESSWKIEGSLGFTQDKNAIYRLFVDGKLIKKYIYMGTGKEWNYFQETFKSNPSGPMIVRITCSSKNHGLLGNVILSSLKVSGPVPKKVILYLVDALRGDMGGVPLEKLFLSKIFKDGTSFKNAYANATQTADSLPNIFTGKYKVLLTGDSSGVPLVGEGEITMPMSLKKSGFITAAFIANPWLLISNSHKGFDYVYTSWNSKIDDLIPDVGSKLPFQMDIETHNFIKKGEIFQEVANFLDRNHDRSFFLFIHALETHAPYALPAEKMFYTKNVNQDLYRSVFPNEEGFWYSLKTPNQNQIDCIKNLYKDNVLDADNSFKELYLLLKNKELLKNLLIILTADHGERMYEHQTWGHGKPDIYNEVLKIPLYINFSKKSLVGVDSVVQSIDLFPTIIDWVSEGKYDEKEFLGSSVRRIHGNESDDGRFVFSEGADDSQFAFITIKRKVIFSKEKVMVFDLDTDPLEQNPLTPKESGIGEDEIGQMLAFRNNLIKANRSSKLALSNKISDEDKKRLKSLGYIK